jgi:hypothetical protein
MRYEALIAAVLVLSQVGASPAAAEPRDASGSPQFTAAETSTVGRNEILRTLIETDPWLVRQFLDAVAERSARDAGFDGEAFVSDTFYAGGEAASPRTAAASIELIQLLRRVKDEKSDKKQTSGRSAKGSVELLESLKRVRKEKGK